MAEPSNLSDEAENEAELESRPRPDPAFKLITAQKAEAAGLKLVNIELPQILTADLVLEIPAEAKLDGTLFSFLTGYEYAVLDFKSENDPLDFTKLQINVARTALFCSRNPGVPFERILNLIVSSRYPQEVLKQAGAAMTASNERGWLWQGGAFYQPLAIVVCRNLPLEPTYADWLIFFPSDSKKWPNVIRELLKMGRRDLVELIIKLKPKEFRAMSLDFETDHLTPEEKARLEQEYLELGKYSAEYLFTHSPKAFAELVAKMPTEELAQTLDAEQVGEFVQALDGEKLSKVEDVLTTDQLEAMLQRKRAKEQGN